MSQFAAETRTAPINGAASANINVELLARVEHLLKRATELETRINEMEHQRCLKDLSG